MDIEKIKSENITHEEHMNNLSQMAIMIYFFNL